jgi:hypothetical protein
MDPYTKCPEAAILLAGLQWICELLKQHPAGSSGGSKSSSANDDDGDSSLGSASGKCNLYDSAVDTSDEEQYADTSLNGYEFYEETSFPAGVDDVVHVGLADLCHRIKAPLYTYNEILRWAQDANIQGYSFPIDAPQYSTFIANLKKQLNVKDYVHCTTSVEAAAGGTVSFPVFDFQSLFLSLIDNPQIKGHLLINWEEPSALPPFDSGSLDEIRSRMWHEQTSAKSLTSNSHDVLCGIILAVTHMWQTGQAITQTCLIFLIHHSPCTTQSSIGMEATWFHFQVLPFPIPWF